MFTNFENLMKNIEGQILSSLKCALRTYCVDAYLLLPGEPVIKGIPDTADFLTIFAYQLSCEECCNVCPA